MTRKHIEAKIQFVSLNYMMLNYYWAFFSENEIGKFWRENSKILSNFTVKIRIYFFQIFGGFLAIDDVKICWICLPDFFSTFFDPKK